MASDFQSRKLYLVTKQKQQLTRTIFLYLNKLVGNPQNSYLLFWKMSS